MAGLGSLEAWDAWKRNDHWKRNDAWSGAGDDLSAPLIDGLIRNREALLVGLPPAESGKPLVPPPARRSPKTAKPKPKQTELDLPEELALCGPDVRLKVLVTEMLQGLHFSAVVADDEEKSACIRLGRNARAPLLAKIIPPDVTVFQAQAAVVAKWAARRSERAPEILTQVGPPMAYWNAIVNLSIERTPKTLEFCNIAMTFASFVVQRVKQILACKRPLAYDLALQPMIPTPSFSAMPSGHATEAFMMAHLLTTLRDLDAPGASLLQRQAERIATNRVVAGLHFPVDSIAGRMLGQTLAEYLLSRSIATPWCARTFRGTKVEPDQSFKYDEDMDSPGMNHLSGTPGVAVEQSTTLHWLWARCEGGNA